MMPVLKTYNDVDAAKRELDKLKGWPQAEIESRECIDGDVIFVIKLDASRYLGDDGFAH